MSTAFVDDRPKHGKPILSLDFDGVLHAYTSGWQGISFASDPPTEGAMDFLREALKHFRISVFSSRSALPEGLSVMRSWLLYHYGQHHGLSHTQAHDELSDVVMAVTKPHAHVSIDDRAITFKGTWPSMDEILNFKPWNRS